MSVVSLTALILAGCAVLGSIGSGLALTYRIGKLVGTVQSLVQQGVTERQLMRQDILHLEAQWDRHEAWHMGPSPGSWQVKPP